MEKENENDIEEIESEESEYEEQEEDIEGSTVKSFDVNDKKRVFKEVSKELNKDQERILLNKLKKKRWKTYDNIEDDNFSSITEEEDNQVQENINNKKNNTINIDPDKDPEFLANLEKNTKDKFKDPTDPDYDGDDEDVEILYDNQKVLHEEAIKNNRKLYGEILRLKYTIKKVFENLQSLQSEYASEIEYIKNRQKRHDEQIGNLKQISKLKKKPNKKRERKIERIDERIDDIYNQQPEDINNNANVYSKNVTTVDIL